MKGETCSTASRLDRDEIDCQNYRMMASRADCLFILATGHDEGTGAAWLD